MKHRLALRRQGRQGQQGEVSGRDRGGAGRAGKEMAPFAQLPWPEVVHVRNTGWVGSAVGLFRGRTGLCGNAIRPERTRLTLPPLFLVLDRFFGNKDFLPSLGRICFISPKFRNGVVFKSLNVCLFIYF